MKQGLTAVQGVLTNIEIAKNDPDFKQTLFSSLSLFKEIINADSFEIIPLDDKVGISKIYQALEIVDSITPNKLSNDKVNRYIQISIA